MATASSPEAQDPVGKSLGRLLRHVVADVFQDFPAIRPGKMTGERVLFGRRINRISATLQTNEGTAILGCAASRDSMFL
jgi:hypothetical protein